MASFNLLPTELIRNIAFFLYPWISSLNLLSRVNRRLHAIIEEELYRADVQHHQSSSIDWAAEHGNLALLQKALNLGKAQIDTRGDLTNAASNDESKDEFIKITRKVETFAGLEFTPEQRLRRDHPISIAARNGHEEVVKYLLNDIGCSPYIRDRIDCCLLSLALTSRLSKDMIKTLTELEVYQYERSRNGIYPLCVAVEIGDEDRVSLLLSHAGYKQDTLVLMSAFRDALFHMKTKIIQRMLEHGCSIFLKRELLLPRYALSFYTAIDRAMSYGDLELVRTLVDGGVDVNFATDDDGTTALFTAMQLRKLDIVEFLAPKTTDRLVQTQILSRLVKWICLGDSADLPDSRYLEILLKNGFNCNFKEKDIKAHLMQQRSERRRQRVIWTPPIVHAIVAGDIEMVRVLISHGANVNTAYRRLDRPLSRLCCGRIHTLALDLGQREIANYLLQSGADPSLKLPPGGVKCSICDDQSGKRI